MSRVIGLEPKVRSDQTVLTMAGVTWGSICQQGGWQRRVPEWLEEDRCAAETGQLREYLYEFTATVEHRVSTRSSLGASPGILESLPDGTITRWSGFIEPSPTFTCKRPGAL